MEKPLKAKPRQVYAFIHDYLEENHYSPSLRDIGEACNLTPAGANFVVKNL